MMKIVTKIIVGAALASMLGHAHARPAHNHAFRHHHSGSWVPALIIGGIIGAALANQQAQQPIYAYPSNMPEGYYPPPSQQPTYKVVDIFVPECNCIRRYTIQVD